MDQAIRRIAGVTVVALTCLVADLRAAEVVLKTWHPWQLDSVLVAWVLQQSRTPQPRFESVPRGSVIPVRDAIDTPESPYRRNGRRTAFEEAVRLERLEHACVPRLRDAVRVVELASWRKPEYPRAEEFEARVLRALPTQPTLGGLDSALQEIDRFCAEPSS